MTTALPLKPCVLLCRVFLNPGAGKRRTGIQSSPWAAQEGQDFLANHVVPSIDLVTTHIWADNWMGWGPGFHAVQQLQVVRSFGFYQICSASFCFSWGLASSGFLPMKVDRMRISRHCVPLR